MRTGQRRVLVEKNPAEAIKVRAAKRLMVRSKGFTEGEAKTVLRAAAGAEVPCLRWVPLLCAYTGARVGEIAQLRREDFRTEGGIPCNRIGAGHVPDTLATLVLDSQSQ